MDRRNYHYQIIMLSKERLNIKKNNIGITFTILVNVMLVLFSSCSDKDKNLAKAISDRDSLPTLHTIGVNTLISDSGITKYKIITEDWKIFSKKEPPYWAFEKGVYLEKFDSLLNIDASIKADTAYYYERQKLWELKGNVHIQNLRGDKFDTSQLYWSEQERKIYSKKPIRIEQNDKSIINGKFGFESNQELTQYTIFNSSGVFTVKDTPPDSTKTDSIK
jgi:LPS export ABC transporter protein LptC